MVARCRERDNGVSAQELKAWWLSTKAELQRLAQQPKNAQSGESFKKEVEDPMKWKIEGSVEA